ncbi:alpha/beta fold hydrolase [Martelella radicis]|uniref:Pimeloyl-ACP methyl ester carboxylesterase n=1 Tax=Martelella radicis TaxID=1397476 RepID=A0A7W6PCJ2_9HYPH|nr:alpha/beta hydrolase [Martelella radicis]MBB4124601.1 pimeloyl-ACP methyl ester carboxylesterase [Martelella radicis]
MWNDEHFLTVSDGTKIHFRDEGGAGEPVLFVHGFTASIGGQWGRPGLIAGMMERGWRAIAFDLRGHGLSDRPHGRSAYGGNRMGLDAIELLDHLGIGRAHIVGYSLGAHIMAHTLLDHRERARTLCLGGAAGRWNWTDAETVAVNDEADELEAGGITRHILRLWPKDTPKPAPDELQRLSERKLAGMDTVALAGIKRAMPDHKITRDDMCSFTMPLFGFVGTRDPQLQAFHTLQQFRPSTEIAEIEDATHGNCPGRPEALDAVDGFLRRHSERTV